ncbi:MAG: Gfo/Idh/MocA family oxidoreductase [Saprospiraceae bacterium]|nr:Gfo/Idh/MocA family oxidoreductase [Saprospiraceae bacterium]
MKANQILLGLIMLIGSLNLHSQTRLAIAGMTHDHVHGILNRMKDGDFKIVGIVEKDKQRLEDLAKRYDLAGIPVFDNLEQLITRTHPQGVCAFGSIADHLAVVEACAPAHIPVMVEKPLAANAGAARRMDSLATQYHIPLLVNYETTWYPALHAAKDWIDAGKIGAIRRMVINMGHQGPKEIGCSQAFLDWLTDPVLNGGGAITDFGCYGTDIAAWLLPNEEPEQILAVTKQFKPQIYPKVDDDATIILDFPSTEVIIQASWNWPFGRKDVVIYGEKGTIWLDRTPEMKVRMGDGPVETVQVDALPENENDAFRYFCGVIDHRIDPQGSLSSIEVNRRAMLWLAEAAQLSKK